MRSTRRLISAVTFLTLFVTPAVPAGAAFDPAGVDDRSKTSLEEETGVLANDGDRRVGMRGSVTVTVPSGTSIQDAIDSNPRGTVFELSGTYSIGSSLVPKTGNVFRGPAVIEADGGTDIGFDLKSAARNVTIRGLEIRGFDLHGVECWRGATIIDSHIHHNGRNGIGCGLDGRDANVRIVNNEIAFNGSEQELGRGGGGMKFARSGIPGVARSGVTIRRNDVHHNVGHGIWWDVNSAGDVVANNVVEYNTRKGIFYETSLGPALITSNRVENNNTSDHNRDGGISAISSTHVTITDNVLSDNLNAGIGIWQTSRGHRVRDVVVSGNTLNGDRLAGCDMSGVRCRHNR